MGVRTVICVVLSVIALAGVASFFFWDDLDELRNFILIAGTPVAIFLAVWRSMVAQEQVEVAQRGLLSNRYQRAVEMLGSDLVAVRIGGIYALQNLALEYDKYQREVWDLLNIYSSNPHRDSLDKDKVVVVVDRNGIAHNLPEARVAMGAADAILEHGKNNKRAPGASKHEKT